MKRLWKWIMKNAEVLNTLLLVCVIVLLILDFGVLINEKTVSVLTVFAVPISVFILLLTLRESRKANKLKVSESLFNHLLGKVENQEFWASKELVRQKEVCDCIDFPKEKISPITFSSFVSQLNQLLSFIKLNRNYFQIIEALKDKNVVEVRDNIFAILEVQKISTALLVIRNLLKNISSNFAFKESLYDEINSSALISEQKKILIDRLNKVCCEFSIFIDILKKNDERSILITEFEMFELKGQRPNTFAEKCEIGIDPHQFIKLETQIEGIRKEYKNQD